MSLFVLQDFKTYKGISSTDRDAQTSPIVDAVNSLVESYCNRKFTEYVSVPKEEFFDGSDSFVYLEEFPVIEIVSVETSADAGQTYSEFLEYYLDSEVGLLETVNSKPFVNTNFPRRSLKVSYKAGYSEIPKDLQLACLDLVEYYLEEQYTPRKALGSDQIYFSDTRNLPPHVKRVFDLYRVPL